MVKCFLQMKLMTWTTIWQILVCWVETPQNHESVTSVKGINGNSLIPENDGSGINTDLDTGYCELMTQTKALDSLDGSCKPSRVEKYSDAKLSGALEQLSASELTVINTLAELSTSLLVLENTDIPKTDSDQLGLQTDHTYAVQTLMLNNHNYCSGTESSLDKPTVTDHQDDPSPDKMDPGQEIFDAEVSENCTIDLAVNDLLLAPVTSVIDVSQQVETSSCIVLDINDANNTTSSQLQDCETDLTTDQYVKGINLPISQIRLSKSNVVSTMGTNSDNIDENKLNMTNINIQGRNPESSSSEFEGFTPDDIRTKHCISSSSSVSSRDSLLDSSDFDYRCSNGFLYNHLSYRWTSL